ncbi:cysteine-rich repeat secretory protein 38-like [Rhododendron vialii]|uniref:cysteine-rich repeat secretory protein 38-like n=1 Tax=Rhododendron vialii TaxID=182163 RepID=UPI002660491E|nr:cysteine-rich repeat secretory protein 38-like [Rhododendron vialii]
MSSSSRLFSLLPLLCFSLLLQLTLATNPTFYSCSSSSGNFSANDPYNQNLNNLTSYLDSLTPLTGFGSASIGLNQTQVTGLALCRGDINSTDCQTCVDGAIVQVQNICPFKKAAFVWYDYCQLKYSNLDFLGQIDYQDWSALENPINASNPVYFNEKVNELLTDLEGVAYTSPTMYASGTLEIGNSTTLYGFVQCTRDLSSTNCKTCIDIAIKVFPYGKIGAKIVSANCNARVEIYPFLNT